MWSATFQKWKFAIKLVSFLIHGGRLPGKFQGCEREGTTSKDFTLKFTFVPVARDFI
jgi:hypothetical protein